MDSYASHEDLGNDVREPARTCQWWWVVIIVCSVLVAVWVVFVAVSATSLSDLDSPSNLANRVTVANIMTHLNNFYEIAEDNGGSRSISTGYDASAKYVIDQLEEHTSFSVTTQDFVACQYTEVARPSLSLVRADTESNIDFLYDIDFRGMRYGGNGAYDFTASYTHLADGADGCDVSDYATVQGTVAVVKLTGGDCDYYTKAFNAQLSGATGVLFYHSILSNSRVRQVEWQVGMPFVDIPVLSITNTVNDILITEPQSSEVKVVTSTTIKTYETFNIIAETKEGDSDNIVMPGAHLDGVQAGPGINDNGSGSATMLETALQLSKISHFVKNKVRFAWWGAEEEGLLGSRYYVQEYLRELSEGAKEQIAVYINHDMLASPNYILAVKNASDAANVLEGGIAVQKLYEAYFQEQNVAYDLQQMRSGSDFQPFVEAGINTGALAAGAGSLKTLEERTLYGGLANGAYSSVIDNPEVWQTTHSLSCNCKQQKL